MDFCRDAPVALLPVCETRPSRSAIADSRRRAGSSDGETPSAHGSPASRPCRRVPLSPCAAARCHAHVRSHCAGGGVLVRGKTSVTPHRCASSVGGSLVRSALKCVSNVVSPRSFSASTACRSSSPADFPACDPVCNVKGTRYALGQQPGECAPLSAPRVSGRRSRHLARRTRGPAVRPPPDTLSPRRPSVRPLRGACPHLRVSAPDRFALRRHEVARRFPKSPPESEPCRQERGGPEASPFASSAAAIAASAPRPPGGMVPRPHWQS